MGAKTAISVEQYLHTAFPDLDREYRDGEIVERTSPDGFGPDYLHGKTQAVLAAFFMALRQTAAVSLRGNADEASFEPCFHPRCRGVFIRPSRRRYPKHLLSS